VSTVTDRSELLAETPVGRLLASTTAHTTFAVATYGVYALTNAWFVSHWVGPVALAAVNVAAPILLLLGAVATTVGAGAASVLSRALGARDLGKAAQVTGTALAGYWLTALVIGGTSIVFLDPLLGVLGARGEVADAARDYAFILLAASVFSTGFSSLVRAEGRIRYATSLWVVPVIVQVIADPVFIIGFGQGVRGAAMGTVCGQIVSAVMGAWYFLGRRDRPYRVGLGDLRPRWRHVVEIAGVGAPSLLSGLGSTALSIVINNLLAVTGGAVGLAAYAIAVRVATFVQMPQLGLVQAMQPIVGFSHGRGLTERSDRALRLSLLASVAYGTVTALLAVAFVSAIASVLTSDPPTRELAAVALVTMALAYPLSGLVPLVAGWFQAIGRARPAFFLVVGTVAGLKLPAVLVLGHYFGLPGIWWSAVVGEGLAALVGVVVLVRMGGRLNRPSAA
jgi:putative MATE family efflux protein